MNPSSRTLSAFFAAGCFVGLAACSSMSIKTAKDPGADFGQYRTYAWAPLPPVESGMTGNSMVDETIRADVEQNLAIKGLSKVPMPQADLLVSYTAIGTDTLTYGAAPGPWLWGPDYDVYPQKVGSLTLQFIDSKNNRTVWQGTAADVVGQNGVYQPQIAEAIKGLLKKYPMA